MPKAKKKSEEEKVDVAAAAPIEGLEEKKKKLAEKARILAEKIEEKGEVKKEEVEVKKEKKNL